MPRERRTDDLLCNQGLLFGYLRLGRLQVRGARIKCGLTDRVRFQLRLVAAIDRLRQFGPGAQRLEPRDIVGGAQLDEHGAPLAVFARLELGKATLRERGCHEVHISVVAVTTTKKKTNK